MRKIWLLVLAMVLFSSAAFAEGFPPNSTNLNPNPNTNTNETPTIVVTTNWFQRQYVWKVYVENSFPFGMVERNIKTRITLKVIHTDEVELGQGFVTVVLRAGREPMRLLIPNDRVLYIIQTNWFHGWDTYGGTE